MLRRTGPFFLLLLCFAQVLCAQNGSADYLPWSAIRKLTINDFSIKIKEGASTPSFAQFTITFEPIGFGFFVKNFNKKVHNYFMPAASWIDTTADVVHSINYQQTLFDLAEVYTRQLRKALRENRKQFLRNSNLLTELNNQYMSAFAKRRVAYDSDTNFGLDKTRQQEWEFQIRKELEELGDFAYEK